MPPTGLPIAIVGVNGGKAETANSCFSSELAWAKTTPAVPELYLNTNAPPRTYVGPGCTRKNASCNSSQYGKAAADYDLTHGVNGSGVYRLWLDVETANSWSGNKSANAQVLQAMMDVFQQAGFKVGIYSTSSMYARITGNYTFPGVALWIPGAQSLLNAPSFCASATTFAGGTTSLVQWTATYDQDYAC